MQKFDSYILIFQFILSRKRRSFFLFSNHRYIWKELGIRAYSLDIISRMRGIFKDMSFEEAISGTRQKAARTVTDSCKYASRLSALLPLSLSLLLPFPIPLKKTHKHKQTSNLNIFSTFFFFFFLKEKEEIDIGNTSSEESIEEVKSNGVVNPVERIKVVAFAKFGDQKETSEALLISLSFQQLQAVFERRRLFLRREIYMREWRWKRARKEERDAYHRSWETVSVSREETRVKKVFGEFWMLSFCKLFVQFVWRNKLKRVRESARDFDTICTIWSRWSN